MHLIYALVATAGETGAEAEPRNPIIPAWNEVIWGFGSFLVLLVLLWKFALPAIAKALKAREDRIRGNLEGAEEAKADADRILEEYRGKLADARAESNGIIEEARKTAEQMSKEVLARAEREAEAVVSRALEAVEGERAAAIEAVRREAAVFSVELAERIVRKTIDRDAQARLIEEYIREVEALSRG